MALRRATDDLNDFNRLQMFVEVHAKCKGNVQMDPGFRRDDGGGWPKPLQ
ncbi:MAG TPA: hypothetical protein VIT90_18450 [Lysobacter sp.]